MAVILIVEDELLIAAEIERTLLRLGHQPLPPVDNAEDALLALGKQPVDLVLMDINIEGDTDGLATALLIRAQFGTPLVFLTALSDPATLNRAKLAQPLGYVLKPFTETVLRTQLELALFNAAQRAAAAEPAPALETAELTPQYFFVRKGNRYVKLLLTDIRYLEALENYVRLHTAKEQFMVYSTLKELESRLPDPPFFRSHRCHIINLDQVQSYEDGYVLFAKDVAVPVSRASKEALKRRLNML